MELDPITADFPSRTAREEDEEAAERATGGGLAPEPVAIVREQELGFFLMAKSSERIRSGERNLARSPLCFYPFSPPLQTHKHEQWTPAARAASATTGGRLKTPLMVRQRKRN